MKLLLLFLVLFASLPASAQLWTIKLDNDIRFYQSTEMGVVIAGTEKSLYAIDGSNGQILWRRKDTSLDDVPRWTIRADGSNRDLPDSARDASTSR